jgi:RHH-type transcriptional regulator, proline utilization regulon repressor / proline dehydrogenase / delta 1-pyrroline-5-carboxylate dehydrogenase
MATTVDAARPSAGGGPAALFPTRLTPADRAAIEARVQVLGRELLDAAIAARPSVLSPDYWAEQAGEWATADDDLKVRLFRLVDCMPMLDDPAAVDRHLREYLDDGTLDRLPGAIGVALKAARSGLLAPLAARAVKAAMLAQARRFIAGTTPAEAAHAARRERRRHRAFTLDLLGETVTSDAEADAYAAAYARLLTELPPEAAAWPHDALVDDGPPVAGHVTSLPRVNVSLKLSALDSRFDAIDPAGTTDRVLSRLRPLWRLARDSGAQIHVDMETHAAKDLTLAIFQRIAMEDEFRDWPHCGIVVQCYLRESPRDLAALAAWARARGAPVWVRLVKGAYWDAETIHARAAGWPIPVWGRKWETDACYEAATTFVMEHADVLRPALGSHNLRSLAHGMAVAEHLGIDRRAVEMQMLYGMGDAEKEAITAAGWRLRVYMPYGELVPGMAYLVRRLLENSANDSFLRAGFIRHVPPERLLAPPVPRAADAAEGSAAAGAVATFTNEPLTDFSIEANRRALAHAIASVGHRLEAGPVRVPVVIDGVAEHGREHLYRENPSHRGQIVAEVALATADDARRGVAVARAALPSWRDVGVHRRADILRAAAAIMRVRRHELAATQVFEVGKPWREADADVAEAIDFCEYYAHSAEALFAPRHVDVPGEENVSTCLPRGVAVVIAPWNFPLAIVAGMTTAALVTGNTVVMKPAEQSSLVASQLHAILLEAGVPPGALALLPGRGEEVGPVLVAHRDTALVAFTGSRAVGLAINRLAAEASADDDAACVKRVIAEMGGKNAIILDDDADLDEAVVAVTASAFGFQGQKCSACSRVIVLDHVHDAFVARLAGAVASLAVGPAAAPGTRVGPVVDAEARDRVRSFIEIGRRTAREVVGVDVGGLADRGWFVGPHVFADVDPSGPLGQEEIFGPVLAVLRARDFDHAIDLANGTRYALTAGVFSRSPARLARARAALDAGNLYMNRGITGALVHRQPFGGYRMSGIGSKTGGPDYLLQFVVPRTVTENTVRRGFAPVPGPDAGRRG